MKLYRGILAPLLFGAWLVVLVKSGVVLFLLWGMVEGETEQNSV